MGWVNVVCHEACGLHVMKGCIISAWTCGICMWHERVFTQPMCVHVSGAAHLDEVAHVALTLVLYATTLIRNELLSTAQLDSKFLCCCSLVGQL